MDDDRDVYQPGKSRIRGDDGPWYPADAHDMQTFRDAQRARAELSAPVLLHADNPHERLYIAAFDGTGNDADKDPEHITNVGLIRNQVRGLNKNGNDRIHAGYVKGIGTQDNHITRIVDGAIGFSYEQRLEDMYYQFVNQSKKWLREDPHAQIRLADTGFSRGGELAASFARLVHERGIVDPDSRVIGHDAHGHQVISYTRTLVPPRQVAQAVGLFDPVATGEPSRHDRRLPPSVISGFQIKAEDEHRNLFKSNDIIDQGLTADGRFLGVTVAGAHSDVGGGYARNGLAVLSGNLMTDYLNSLSDTPFLQKRALPEAPGMYVVHRSEEGLLLYRVLPKVDRLQPAGCDDLLVPDARRLHIADPRNAEPVDRSLDRQFHRRPVPDGPLPAQPKHGHAAQKDRAAPAHSAQRAPESETDLLFGRLVAAAKHRDAAAMHSVLHDHARTPHGQRWAAEILQHVQQAIGERQPVAMVPGSLLVQQQAPHALAHGTPVMRL